MKTKDRPASDRLHDVREELAYLTTEARRLATLPPPLEEVVERLNWHVDELGSSWDPVHRFTDLLRPEPPAGLSTFLPIDRRETEAALCALVGPALKALMRDKLAAAVAGQETIPTAERTARLAELATRRRQLEVQEERIVRELEIAGVDCDRRASIDPAVLFEVCDEMDALAVNAKRR